MITQEELKEILHYDPETGIFTWLAVMGRARPGHRAGHVNNVLGYVLIKIRTRRYLAHRLAWLYIHGYLPPDDTDHINGIRGDNRISNLRPATRSENTINQGIRCNNTSGYKGVYWDKQREKWHARCRADGKTYYLGRFDAVEDASAVYQAFAAKHHGAFFNDGTC